MVHECVKTMMWMCVARRGSSKGDRGDRRLGRGKGRNKRDGGRRMSLKV